MPLQCNIDRKGRLARFIYGAIVTIAGLAMIFLWAIPSGSIVAWGISAAVIAGGAFAIFEAKAGWCVVRAIGFKTPL